MRQEDSVTQSIQETGGDLCLLFAFPVFIVNGGNEYLFMAGQIDGRKCKHIFFLYTLLNLRYCLANMQICGILPIRHKKCIVTYMCLAGKVLFVRPNSTGGYSPGPVFRKHKEEVLCVISSMERI